MESTRFGSKGKIHLTLNNCQLINRAEMARMIARYRAYYREVNDLPVANLDLSDQFPQRFTDIDQIPFYGYDLRECVYLGYIKGRNRTTLALAANVTRAEAMTMLYRLYKRSLKPDGI